MTTSRAARWLSLGLSFAFLSLLVVLHALEPEFNTGHLISEYQLGDYGLLMSLAFCLLGGSTLLLALALRPRLPTHGARVGWYGLLVIGAAFFVAGIFPPVQAPPITGYLHGVAGLVVIFGSPIVFACVSRGLARTEAPSVFSRRMRWATLAAWLGLGCFVGSLAIIAVTGQKDVPLHPSVSLANRFMIVTYCIWLISAAWKSDA